MSLHPVVKNRIEDIAKITIRTHEAAIRIIDKKGPLANPADRDHCIQYMVAVPLVFGRLTAADYEDDIARITIRTHESAIRIIDKKGPLNNPADRDHCIQYMVAVPLIYGRLTAADYEDEVAHDARIDNLRDKMVCVEDKQFSRDYLDPEKRSIANGLTVEFKDGKKLAEVVVEYPIGHKRRRKDGIPFLVEKFERNLARRFPEKQQKQIRDLCMDAKRLEQTPVREFVDLMVI